MKKCFLDIETSPILCESWSMYTEPIRVIKDWNIICFAYKFEGEDIKFHAVWHDSNNPRNDRKLIKHIIEVLDQADIIIGHNLDKFDLRKINARAIKYGFSPPSPYRTVDTLKVAKKYFNLTSNRLNEVAKHLNVEQKIEHEGFMALWDGVQSRNKQTQKTFEEYNKQDIRVTEQVYNKMKGWIDNHPNLSFAGGLCPNCASNRVEKRGYRFTQTSAYQRWCCKDCGRWSSSRLASTEIDKPKLK